MSLPLATQSISVVKMMLLLLFRLQVEALPVTLEKLLLPPTLPALAQLSSALRTKRPLQTLVPWLTLKASLLLLVSVVKPPRLLLLGLQQLQLRLPLLLLLQAVHQQQQMRAQGVQTALC